MAVILTSCANSESLRKEAEEKLETRYGEKFDILSFNEVVLEQPRYEFTACPHAKPEYVFELTMSKGEHAVIDNYIGMRWIHEASDSLKSYLLRKESKVAALVEPRLAYLEQAEEKNIISFDQALEHQVPEDYLIVTVYFFRDYNDTTASDIFNTIRRVVTYYNQKNVLAVNYEFEFYDEQYFKNKDIRGEHFTFQGRIFHFPDSFEVRNREQGRHSLYFNYVLNDPLPSDSLMKEKMFDWKQM